MTFGLNFPKDFDPNRFPVEVRGGGITYGKFLTDLDGYYIMNPLNKMPYVVPADFSLQAAIEYGQQLGGNFLDTRLSFVELYESFRPGGPWDLQRTYNGVSGPFVSAFTDGASFVFGIVGRAAGYSEWTILAGGGAQNIISGWRNSKVNQSGSFWNNPDNVVSMREAFSFASEYPSTHVEGVWSIGGFEFQIQIKIDGTRKVSLVREQGDSSAENYLSSVIEMNMNFSKDGEIHDGFIHYADGTKGPDTPL